MSKQKAAKKAVKKKAKSAKPAARKAAPARRALKAAAPANKVAAATIFVYDTAGGTRVRTTPQLLRAADGCVEWTVVNLTSGAMPDVDITWVDGSPWGGHPIKVSDGHHRKDILNAKKGRFKYNVICNGYTEDPEIEYPEN